MMNFSHAYPLGSIGILALLTVLVKMDTVKPAVYGRTL